jgi:D-amino-acid dehydrogenase
MNNKMNDVVVVGGGVVGCWTALHLAQAGCKVALLERDSIGRGASYGNCGYVSPSHVHPLSGPGAIKHALEMMVRSGGALSVPPRWDPALWGWFLKFRKNCRPKAFEHGSRARHALLQSARSLYTDFAEQHSDALQWQTAGLMMVYRSPERFEQYASAAEQLQRDFGLQINRYEGDQVSDVEPALQTGLAGGWHFPDDAHLHPGQLMQKLRDELEASGVVIRENCSVDRFVMGAGGLNQIDTDTGEAFAADGFVIAAGAETSRFAKSLGCKIPVVPGKGFSVTIQGAASRPTIPMIFEDDHVAVTPLDGALRIGSTMQFVGFDRSIPEHRIELLKRSAKLHLKDSINASEGEAAAQEERWSGWRPMSPDGIPIISRLPKARNVCLATGNGMIGIACGPATAKLAAELMLEQTPHVDPEPYRVERFN